MFLKAKSHKRSYLPKLMVLGLILVYLMGYYPVFAIPPLKKSTVEASNAVLIEENINASSFSEAFKLPHPGYLSTKFSLFHPGVDIATGLGMPVRPIMKGKVVDVQYTFWGLGHFVTIEHEQGYKSTYGHMGRIFVKIDDEVKSDSILGDVGLTGWTSGPHTHLEVYKDGKAIDPTKVLPAIPNWEEYAKQPLPQESPLVQHPAHPSAVSPD